ncbi:MAG: hypothetical protein IIC56_09280 [Proteobacteria bacterium]|nr:hypothetical protein [Pseudomonadota bacterium]
MRVFFGGNKVFLALALLLAALSPLAAGAAEKIGVLLLHGKAGGNKSIYHLSGELESAGFLVEMPSSAATASAPTWRSATRPTARALAG